MFVVSVVTVNAIPHSRGQQNQHFVDRLRHPSARFEEIFPNRQFCNPKRLSARRKKADPHNLKIFVGLIAMPTHPIEIAFSGKSWYITSKNNVDNCRAFSGAINKMLISLIAGMAGVFVLTTKC
mgnify:CR=1 FL=1